MLLVDPEVGQDFLCLALGIMNKMGLDILYKTSSREEQELPSHRVGSFFLCQSYHLFGADLARPGVTIALYQNPAGTKG